MTKTIRIFITDDHPIVRDGLVAILETQSDFQVIGEAANGRKAIEKLSQDPADILFLDLGMPELDGVEVIKKLKSKNIPSKIIVFTVFDTDERIVSALKAGAMGYLLKGASHSEIFKAIRVVHSGESLLQPIIASKLVQHLSDPPTKLSPRELEVLQFLAKGMTNKAIASQLFISERTVKFHLSAIFSKLGVSNRTEAVQMAIRKGMIA